jgi:hypothetical protein
MPDLYLGLWPQNVSKMAKYSIGSVQGAWKVRVEVDLGSGLRYIATEDGAADLVGMVNATKAAAGQPPGGVFYLNEFRHVLVPVPNREAKGTGSIYYYAGEWGGELRFEFDGSALTSRPISKDGTALAPGGKWVGPRPGIPYVLAAGGVDIYYDTPALKDGKLWAGVTQRVKLSEKIGAPKARLATHPVASLKGHMGGRFYVNEHGAMFAPMTNAESAIEYLYCGTIDPINWFPNPLATSTHKHHPLTIRNQPTSGTAFPQVARGVGDAALDKITEAARGWLAQPINQFTEKHEESTMDKDWTVDTSGKCATHNPSGTHFYFYDYQDPKELRSASTANLGEKWDDYYNSIAEMQKDAITIYRAALKLPPL